MVLKINVEIRQATADDVETVVQILRRSRCTYLPFAKPVHTIEQDRQWALGQLIPSGGVVIAQLDLIAVGVLATSVCNKIGWIDQLYLEPRYVGRGIGVKLLDHAKKVLPRPIHLWTFQQNRRAIAFYERNGFNAIKFTDGTDNEERCPDILFEYT